MVTGVRIIDNEEARGVTYGEVFEKLGLKDVHVLSSVHVPTQVCGLLQVSLIVNGQGVLVGQTYEDIS